jgi:hypothetical protein
VAARESPVEGSFRDKEERRRGARSSSAVNIFFSLLEFILQDSQEVRRKSQNAMSGVVSMLHCLSWKPGCLASVQENGKQFSTTCSPSPCVTSERGRASPDLTRQGEHRYAAFAERRRRLGVPIPVMSEASGSPLASPKVGFPKQRTLERHSTRSLGSPMSSLPSDNSGEARQAKGGEPQRAAAQVWESEGRAFSSVSRVIAAP